MLSGVVEVIRTVYVVMVDIFFHQLNDRFRRLYNFISSETFKYVLNGRRRFIEPIQTYI